MKATVSPFTASTFSSTTAESQIDHFCASEGIIPGFNSIYVHSMFVDMF